MAQNGLLDLISESYQRNVGRPFAQLAGNGMRGLLGLELAEYADNSGREAYRTGQALSNTPTPLALAALPAAVVKGAKSTKLIDLLKNADQSMPTKSMRSGKIADPAPLSPRNFLDDYPKGTGKSDGSRLAVDIDGNPLTARYIAGRRVGGGVDESLGANEIADVIRALGARQRTADPGEIGADLGRFNRRVDGDGNVLREVVINQSLPAGSGYHVMGHEAGHLVEDMTMPGAIPLTGVKRDAQQVYSDLNSATYVPKGKIGAKPENQGYKAKDADGELVAESIRAYMRDPNYIKTVAPGMAKRIREYVNRDPNLRKIIQFNTMASGGLLGGGLLSQEEAD